MDGTSSPSEGSELQQWVTAIIRGDEGAFRTLYLERFEALCRYAALVVSDDEARDIVQEVFLSLWERREFLSVENDKELGYYLLRAVRNRAVSMVRRGRLHDKYLLSAEYDRPDDMDIDGPEADVVIGEDDNEADFAKRERLADSPAALQELIESLPSRSRELLVLRWFHGLPFDKIATLMGVSYPYTHVLHSRALVLIRKKLGLS